MTRVSRNTQSIELRFRAVLGQQHDIEIDLA